MVHRRLVYIYLLNMPSFSSRYFNKIKRTSRLCHHFTKDCFVRSTRSEPGCPRSINFFYPPDCRPESPPIVSPFFMPPFHQGLFCPIDPIWTRLSPINQFFDPPDCHWNKAVVVGPAGRRAPDHFFGRVCFPPCPFFLVLAHFSLCLPLIFNLLMQSSITLVARVIHRPT